MLSVLVVAADPNIETLLGELVAFAGQRPLFDVTLGAAGESVRRIRPELLLLDTALSAAVVAACLDAAKEVGCAPIVVSSDASERELANQADAFHCHYFPLPGGARLLREVLDRALAARPHRDVALPLRAEKAGSVHPSLRAALANVSRARALGIQAENVRRESWQRRSEMRSSLDAIHRSRAQLRAAITDLALQLKASEVPLERIVSIVQASVADCATVVGAQAAVPALLLESEEWVRSAYFAA